MRVHDTSSDDTTEESELDARRFVGSDRLSAAIDRLSLDQALHDFETANARVVDLTQRLIVLAAENRALHNELETLRIQYEKLHAHFAAQERSRVYKAAKKILDIRQLLRS